MTLFEALNKAYGILMAHHFSHARTIQNCECDAITEKLMEIAANLTKEQYGLGQDR